MSLTTRNPLRVGGANVNSGYPQTGELNVTRGGNKTATMWSGSLTLSATALLAAPGASGIGNSHMLQSGPGRLCTIIPHDLLTSGQSVTFYDAGILCRSGAGVAASILAESGAKVLAKIQSPYRAPLAAISGNIQVTVNWQDQIQVDVPFFSGLCVAAASGAPGFTATWNVETVPATPQ